MNKKRVIGVLLASLIVWGLFVGFVGAQGPPTFDDSAGEDFFRNFADFVNENSAAKFTFGILFGLWNPNDVVRLFDTIPLSVGDGGGFFTLTSISALVILIIVWIVFLIVFRDILEIASPLGSGANWAVAVGLTIVASQLRFTSWLSVRFAIIASTIAAVSVWLMVVIIIIVALGIGFVQTWAMKWVLKMRMAREANRVDKSAEEVAAGISALKTVEESFRRL